jgi:hypothetical protein
MLTLLLTVLRAEDCTPGIKYRKNSSSSGWSGTAGSANIKHSAALTWRYLAFQGSFVASTTGTHTFEIYSSPLGVSSEVKADWQFEDYYQGYTEGTHYHTPSLYTDFRYRFQTQTSPDRCYLELQIRVALPGENLAVLTSSHADVCFENGCKSAVYVRANDCRPPPSHSPSPLQSRTRSSPATMTATQPATEAATPTKTFPATLKPTPAETPIGTPSSLFTLSKLWSGGEPSRALAVSSVPQTAEARPSAAFSPSLAFRRRLGEIEVGRRPRI